jgi:hypothetical protein
MTDLRLIARRKPMSTTKEILCPTCGAVPGKMCVSVAAGKPLSDIHAARHLLSINQAAGMGIERLRKPVWSNKLDHLKIDIFDGRPGPWLHLFGPFNKECNGRDPVDMLIIDPMVGDLNAEQFEIYVGPLPTSPKYIRAAAAYEGCLA